MMIESIKFKLLKALSLFILTSVYLCFGFIHDGMAEDFSGQNPQSQAVITKSPISLAPGLLLEYEAYSHTHPYRPPVREDFTIKLTEVWPDGVSFQYSSKDETIGVSSGMESLSSMDDCPNLDPWWEPMSIGHDDRCELWASRHVLQEIVTTGVSWMNIDTAARQDTSVRWNFEEYVRYLCILDGRPQLLNAIKVKTSREDEIIMLDDPRNPLILRIKSMYFNWDLRKITTAK